MKMKRIFALLLSAALVSALFTGVGFAAESEEEVTEVVPMTEEEPEAESEDEDSLELSYPIWNIAGIVPWGEGGSTDTLMRALGIATETIIGQTIDVQDMPGNSGATGLEYVYDQPSDGYTILMAAENAPLYDALGISELSYDDFDCVLLIGDQTTAVVVPADSPYESVGELFESAATGHDIVMAGTGTGALPWTMGGLITAITDAQLGIEDYDGDASAIQAVIDGEAQFTISKLGAVRDDYENGDVKLLCVIADEEDPDFPGVPPITDDYPEFEEYLPWGPFCGVFVTKDTDPEIVQTLTDAFQEGFEDADFQAVLEENVVNPLGYSGDEANEYISNWADTTLGALEEAGLIS